MASREQVDSMIQKALAAIGPFTALDAGDLGKAVILASLKGRSLDEEELLKISEWASEIYTGANLLGLVLAGRVEVSVSEGKVAFRTKDAPAA